MSRERALLPVDYWGALDELSAIFFDLRNRGFTDPEIERMFCEARYMEEEKEE